LIIGPGLPAQNLKDLEKDWYINYINHLLAGKPAPVVMMNNYYMNIYFSLVR
jgi:hypothetical protein